MIIFGFGAQLDGIGGVENSIRCLLRELSPSERAIVVCYAPDKKNSISYDLDIPENVRIIECGSSLHLFRKLSSIYSALYSDYPDARVICRHHLHVLAARKAGFYSVYLIPSMLKNQISYEVHGKLSFAKLRLWCFGMIHSRLQRRAILEANENFVFSQGMRKEVVASSKGHLSVSDVKIVKPGVDSTRYFLVDKFAQKFLRHKLGIPLETKILLFVGRVVAAKGLDVVINALKLLPDDYCLVVVGSGDKELELKSLVVNLNLTERVMWCGAKSNVNEYYQASDVFIMSSYYEPLGQTILEATACGLPVVAFKKSQFVDTATQELGLDLALTVVDLPDPGLLAVGVASTPLSYERSKSISAFTISLFGWRRLFEDLCS